MEAENRMGQALSTSSVAGNMVRQVGEGGGGFMGWVIRIIFDPNTRQWGGGGGLWGR